MTIAGDIGNEAFYRQAVMQTLSEIGKIDILINNAAVMFYQLDITQVSSAQLELTFRTNVFSCVYFVKAAIPHLQPCSAIINTSSIASKQGYAGFTE